VASLSGFFGGASRPIRSLVLASVLVVALASGPSLAHTSGVQPAAAAAAHVTMGGTLVIDNESGALWTGNFNPFSGAVNWTAIGIIYEPLMYVNPLTGKVTPMLATGYQWGAGNKTLTFTIRNGVQWSDGKPFSAADVAFTFNLLKKFPSADLQAVWTVLKSVEQQGSDKVVFTFAQPAVPYFYNIADLNGIVAQHVWATVKDPATYSDSNPVGTGPFMLGPSSPQTITYVRNPHYWVPGKPYLDKVLYPAFTSNPAANVYLAEGKADWGGQFIPSIDAYYVSRDRANNHYWFAPTDNVSLYINQTVAGLNNKLVRQAMAYAIDRNRVSKIGEYGYEPAANQSGIILPTFAAWQDKAQAAQYNYTYNPAKAAALLQQAGAKKNGSGIYVLNGKPLSFSVINVGGNTDWVSSLQVITAEFQAVGIGLTVQNLSQTDYSNRAYNGQYDLLYDTPPSFGPSPYYELRETLCSCNTAPIGKVASSNFERWNDPATDALLKQFDSTADTATQHAIVNKLQTVMLQDVPVIPVTEGVAWYQYSTKKFAGWPTPQNPYASPAPYNWPDWEVVLQNLHLK
jgi:peptide/nickel transport system substrate-binding protein